MKPTKDQANSEKNLKNEKTPEEIVVQVLVESALEIITAQIPAFSMPVFGPVLLKYTKQAVEIAVDQTYRWIVFDKIRSKVQQQKAAYEKALVKYKLDDRSQTDEDFKKSLRDLIRL